MAGNERPDAVKRLARIYELIRRARFVTVSGNVIRCYRFGAGGVPPDRRASWAAGKRAEPLR